jgi:novobiocin biosynthesis protein NovU/D-mycarose 3-C-methyltransferase
MKINKCPITDADNGVKYLDLGDIPLVNNLCSTRESSLACKRYPLSVQLFQGSGLSCLTELIPKEELFSHYLYKSGVSKPYISHCSQMYDYLDKYVNLEYGGIVVDIGGNDGSLLNEFKKKNGTLTLINVDPCIEFADENMREGISYHNAFFGEEVVLPAKATLIISTNVFQHNWDIRSFVKGVHENLDTNGIWCLEFPYWLTTILTDNYDQVYHEHVYYYILSSLLTLFKQEGLKVINVSYHPIHAGTLRVISAKEESSLVADSSIDSFLNLEQLMTESFYIKWGNSIQTKISECEDFIKGFVHVYNARIFGFGAAAKGCIFLNTCHLTDTDMPFVIDDTPEKQGMFIPGTGIEIVSRDILKKWHPNYILILAHNFKDYIIKSLRNDGYIGGFIIMFPEIEVID